MTKKQKSLNAKLDDLLEGLDLPSDAELRKETGLRKRSDDPTWHANNQKAIDKKKQDSTWYDNLVKRNKKLVKDPVRNQKIKETVKQQYQDPVYKDYRTTIIKNVTQTEEWKKSHSKGMNKREENGWHEKNNAAAQKRCKPIVSTEYGIFLGKKHLAEHMTSLGIGNVMGKLDNWLKTKPTEFYYISKEEYIMLTGKEI